LLKGSNKEFKDIRRIDITGKEVFSFLP